MVTKSKLRKSVTNAIRARTLTALVPLNSGFLTTVSSFGLLSPVTFGSKTGDANITLAANGQVSVTSALTAGQSQTIGGKATGADEVVIPFSITLTGGITLAALTLSGLTATAGQPWSGTISGKTSGSTITATSSDGAVLSVSGNTVSGTFLSNGAITVTLVESYSGALNSGRASPSVVSVSPALVVVPPAAPTVSLTPGNGQVSVAWVDGSNGNATITAHTIYVNGVALASITSVSPYIVTGLTNGISVDIRVSATNSAGEGVKSATQTTTPIEPPAWVLGSGLWTDTSIWSDTETWRDAA